jgi:acetyltransferase
VSRYIRNPDGVSAEFGVIVEDAWQGRGLGHLLMQTLEDTATQRNLGELIGIVLRENDEMGRLMHSRGYVAHRDEEDPQVMRYIKQLAGAVQAADSAAG